MVGRAPGRVVAGALLHFVFTLPARLAEIAFQNKAVVYAILFRAAAEMLKSVAADPRHLDAEIGFISILHTWGQTLTHHPHVHCVVPGGGLSPACAGQPSEMTRGAGGRRRFACRPRFFLPIHVLSRLYRRLFLEQLQAASDAGRLRFFGAFAGLAKTPAFAAQIRTQRQSEWIVYAKPPFGSPAQVLAYRGI